MLARTKAGLAISLRSLIFLARSDQFDVDPIAQVLHRLPERPNCSWACRGPSRSRWWPFFGDLCSCVCRAPFRGSDWTGEHSAPWSVACLVRGTPAGFCSAAHNSSLSRRLGTSFSTSVVHRPNTKEVILILRHPFSSGPPFYQVLADRHCVHAM